MLYDILDFSFFLILAMAAFVAALIDFLLYIYWVDELIINLFATKFAHIKKNQKKKKTMDIEAEMSMYIQ